MTDRQERIQVLYEISLSIGREEDLQSTARTALSAYLRKLNCTAGAVLERREDAAVGTETEPTGTEYERVAAVPAEPGGVDAYRQALATASEWTADTLPRTEEFADRPVHVMSLPEFGVLVLVDGGTPIDDQTRGALRRLNGKLAEVCRAERTERERDRQRNRFEAVFNALRTPVVNVVTDEDGHAVVRDANDAFGETFGSSPGAVQGRRLDEVLSAPSEEVDDTLGGGRVVTDGSVARRPGDWADADQPVRRTVRRETVDGPRTFAVRTAPVTVGRAEVTELYALYLDVTERQRREQTLEQLYQAAQELLNAESQHAVCQQAVEAAAGVLEFETTGVHLYDRQTNGLVPACTRGTETLLDGEPPTYTDRSTAVWMAYRERRPVVVEDTETYAGRLPGGAAGAASAVRSAMVLPLGEHGVFITSASESGAFDDTDRYFGRLLATMLQTALDRVSREQSLRAVQETTESMAAAESVTEVCDILATRAAETFDLPVVAVWEHRTPENVLDPVASSEEATTLLEEVPTFDAGEAIAWEVFESGAPEIVDHLDRRGDAHDSEGELASEIIVPIGDFGVVAAGSTLRADFSQEDMETLQALAAGAESAVRIVEQREELATLDQVLGRILRHNVRNDLTGVIGWAELLAEELDGEPAEWANRVQTISANLLDTTEHAREIREVVKRHGEQTTLELDAAVAEAVETARRNHPDAEITVGDGLDHTVRVHPELHRAFRHAIENGIVHDDGDGRVTVGGHDTTDGFCVTVTDEGPGIPQSELEPLAAGGETALKHGSGAGLWIIDRLLDYSGGTARYEVDETGTTVYFEFDDTAVVG